GGDHLLDGGDDGEEVTAAGMDEALRDQVIDEVQERVPVTVEVNQHDRLVVQPKLPPGQNLERLVERAEAARQDGKGVRQLDHQALAGVHAVDDMQLGHAAVADLAGVEEFGNDPDHLAAAVE